MSSIDMCKHDWPGSGCKECFPPIEPMPESVPGSWLDLGDIAHKTCVETSPVFCGSTYYISRSPDNKSFVEVTEAGVNGKYILLGNRADPGYRRFAVDVDDIDNLICALQEVKERYFSGVFQ